MKRPNIHSGASFTDPARSRSPGGFALIVTLVMVSLVTLLAMALLALSTNSRKMDGAGRSRVQAQSNALTALALALGDLQKEAGKDQRVTRSTSAEPAVDPGGAKTPLPGWTGVLNNEDKSLAEVWLVSGSKKPGAGTSPAEPNPWMALDQSNSVILARFGDAAARKEIRVPATNIAGSKDRMAWWIGDSGVKARVDLKKPGTDLSKDPARNKERLALAQSAQEPDLSVLGPAWSGLASSMDYPREKLLTLESVGLATGDAALPSANFLDLTTTGEGLPVDIAKGGLKADLSIITDKSQEAKGYATRYLGFSPPASTATWPAVVTPSANGESTFYLCDSLLDKNLFNAARGAAGPNWAVLWRYARLWDDAGVKSGAGTLIPVTLDKNQAPEIRTNLWKPYTWHDAGDYRRDYPHFNSPVTPVLSTIQLGMRFKARDITATGATKKKYQLQLEFKPLIGLWNPYNVPIKATRFWIDWKVCPMIRIGAQKPGAASTTTLPTIWMRNVFGNTGGWFRMSTVSTDFQPGEFRLFSIDTKVPLSTSTGAAHTLYPKWSEQGAFQYDVPGTDAQLEEGAEVWMGNFYLEDTQDKEFKTVFPTISVGDQGNFLTLKIDGTSNGNNDYCFGRYTNPWLGGEAKLSWVPSVPERVISGTGGGATKKRHRIADLASEHGHIATWRFAMRTSSQLTTSTAGSGVRSLDTQAVRGWYDTNPRAIANNPLWELGSLNDATGQRVGFNFTNPLMGDASGSFSSQVGDSRGGFRGLIAEGDAGDQTPQTPGGARYQGYGGPSNTASGGQSHVIAFDVPRSPLVSLGQFQHAGLSRYQFEPGYVVGNSYANFRIPLDKTIAPNAGGVTGLHLVDISHEVNTRLWDRFYFSSLGIDFVGSGSSFDTTFGFENLATGKKPLPNPRMRFVPMGDDSSIDTILANAKERAPEAMSARLRINGAFNVNSTSKVAWKAVLSSMTSSELPWVNKENGQVSWQKPGGIRFNRFGHVMTDSGYETNGDGAETEFWLGWRKLTTDELDKLAEEIVKEVEARGPFRSLAEFINRNPASPVLEHRRKGALQAALDRVVNDPLPPSVGLPVKKLPDTVYSDALASENQSAGHASYLAQGDVLQSLGPVLQARSDHFVVRAYGEANHGNGKAAMAYCEAVLQRIPDYVDSTYIGTDKSRGPHLLPAEMGNVNQSGTAALNNKFGRRFKIVSFRWLGPSEI